MLPWTWSGAAVGSGDAVGAAAGGVSDTVEPDDEESPPGPPAGPEEAGLWAP